MLLAVRCGRFMTTNRPPTPCPYRVLGVESTASQDEIRAAYFERAKETHPDASRSAQVEEFRQVAEAYALLSDLESRREYDRQHLYAHRPRDFDSSSSQLFTKPDHAGVDFARAVHIFRSSDKENATTRTQHQFTHPQHSTYRSQSQEYADHHDAWVRGTSIGTNSPPVERAKIRNYSDFLSVNRTWNRSGRPPLSARPLKVTAITVLLSAAWLLYQQSSRD